MKFCSGKERQQEKHGYTIGIRDLCRDLICNLYTSSLCPFGGNTAFNELSLLTISWLTEYSLQTQHVTQCLRNWGLTIVYTSEGPRPSLVGALHIIQARKMGRSVQQLLILTSCQPSPHLHRTLKPCTQHYDTTPQDVTYEGDSHLPVHIVMHKNMGLLVYMYGAFVCPALPEHCHHLYLPVLQIGVQT